MPLFGGYPSHSIKLEAAGLEPALRFSISIMPALPVIRLMHYSTHLTRKRELSYASFPV